MKAASRILLPPGIANLLIGAVMASTPCDFRGFPQLRFQREIRRENSKCV